MLRGLLSGVRAAKTATQVRKATASARSAIKDAPKIKGKKEEAALNSIDRTKDAMMKKVGRNKTEKSKTLSIPLKRKYESKMEEGQAPSRGTLDVEAGKAGKVTVGKLSMPRMQDSASKGSTKRAKKVAELETKKEKGSITAQEKKELSSLNAASKRQDVARTRKAAATRSTDSRKDKGISLAGEDDAIIKVGKRTKVKDADMMVGNTSNGITKDGEIIGNPTDNQIATVVRNMDARNRLSSAAKRNLAKLKRMNKSQRQSAAITKLERNLKNTGPDKSGRPMAKGGLTQPAADQAGLKKLPTAVRNKMGYMKRGGVVTKGHTDMRKGGLFR